jgi:hypothetical protein
MHYCIALHAIRMIVKPWFSNCATFHDKRWEPWPIGHLTLSNSTSRGDRVKHKTYWRPQANFQRSTQTHPVVHNPLSVKLWIVHNTLAGGSMTAVLSTALHPLQETGHLPQDWWSVQTTSCTSLNARPISSSRCSSSQIAACLGFKEV